MKKKILVFLIITILSVSFFAIRETKAGPGDNVWGWAWSENIGWISFNNISGGGAIDYGVNIDGAGLFSGYAWSENIGWISFEPADVNVAGCPDSPADCQADLDLSTGEVSGWARALSYGGGWDGWIKLSGSWTDGVSVISNSSPPPASVFEGWAWGDVVVGWISFNCSNTAGACVTSDYKVMTSVVINNPPTAINLNRTEGNYCGCAISQVTQCSGSKSSPPIYLNWTFDDPGDTQSVYQVEIHRNSSYTSLAMDSGEVNTSGPGPDYSYAPSGLNFNTPYWWRLKVWDGGTPSLESDWIYPAVSPFTTDIRWPNTAFVPDLLNPPAQVEVTFIDESKCYTSVGVEYDCKDGAGVSYSWDFDYDGSFDPTDWTKGDTVYTYLLTGDYIVRLEVTGSMCPCVFPLTATLPLPTWKEITPF